MSVYGYCPKCGAPGKNRERNPNGNDTCENEHVYPSREALSTAPVSISITFLRGLRNEQIEVFVEDFRDEVEAAGGVLAVNGEAIPSRYEESKSKFDAYVDKNLNNTRSCPFSGERTAELTVKCLKYHECIHCEMFLNPPF